MSGAGAQREREGASERGEWREGGEVGEAGEEGGAPLRRSHGPANARPALSPELGGACERPFAAAAAAAATRGGGESRGPRPGTRGGVPPQTVRCAPRQKQAAGSAEKAARPGAAGQSRGCRWAPVPSALGSGSPCPWWGRRAPVDPRLAPASTRTD